MSGPSHTGIYLYIGLKTSCRFQFKIMLMMKKVNYCKCIYTFSAVGWLLKPGTEWNGKDHSAIPFFSEFFDLKPFCISPYTPKSLDLGINNPKLKLFC